MDIILAYVVRLMVWLSALMKPLARWGVCRYDEWTPGARLKILLVGYNGARNTGADARVVALTLPRVLGRLLPRLLDIIPSLHHYFITSFYFM